MITKAEFDSLIASVLNKFVLSNTNVINSIRLGYDNKSSCCIRTEEDNVFLLLYVASNYEMNDDGSTTGKINYVTDENFLILVDNMRKIIIQ